MEAFVGNCLDWHPACGHAVEISVCANWPVRPGFGDQCRPCVTILNFLVADINEATGEPAKLGIRMEQYNQRKMNTDAKVILRNKAGSPGLESHLRFKDLAGQITSVLTPQLVNLIICRPPPSITKGIHTKMEQISLEKRFETYSLVR